MNSKEKKPFIGNKGDAIGDASMDFISQVRGLVPYQVQGAMARKVFVAFLNFIKKSPNRKVGIEALQAGLWSTPFPSDDHGWDEVDIENVIDEARAWREIFDDVLLAPPLSE